MHRARANLRLSRSRITLRGIAPLVKVKLGPLVDDRRICVDKVGADVVQHDPEMVEIGGVEQRLQTLCVTSGGSSGTRSRWV
jgi:hypothetical protein